MPETGVGETGLVSILDTSFFSVSIGRGRHWRIGKIFTGDTYGNAGNKYGDMAPKKILELNYQLKVEEKSAPRCYMAESFRGMGSRWQDIKTSHLK